jgi:hypothetical protein
MASVTEMQRFEVIDSADQQFGAVIDNQRVTIRLRYNPTGGCWSFDLSIDDTPVLHGRRIVLFTDLLAPFDFGVGSIFALPTREGETLDRQTLPAGTVRLYHATAAEIEAALAA